ncbi:erythromycin esterase family protein [Myxococcus sp. Y35]|uniref:erythromycin esterase family protein n=1 Tax=Pseudomyxococcus flavus TaxID=3115648 RepID=UPI003CF76753
MRYLLFLSLLLSGCVAPSQSVVAAREPLAASDADRIVRDLCDKRLALLGEESHHGSARTIAFKVELTRRLMEECQYDGFIIETGLYDFLHIQSRLDAGEPVDEAMVADAIGGMWANQEMEPLIPVLTKRLTSGTLIAGGLDDQVNRGTYAQREMTRELMPYLAGPRQAECGAEIERYMSWRYDDAHRFTAERARFIQGCWKELETVLAGPAVPADSRARGHLRMVRNLDRFFERQAAVMSRPQEQAGAPQDWSDFNHRARSMFMNLEAFLAQSPRPRKTIVWLATIHAAKSLASLEKDGRHPISFGTQVQERFGDQAFVLGFSALSGSYSLASTPRRYVLEPALEDSLEAWAFSAHTADTRYLDRGQLRDARVRAARPLSYAWVTAPWETVMDGLLIFREERPPSAVSR